jgi:hypothetical protein
MNRPARPLVKRFPLPDELELPSPGQEGTSSNPLIEHELGETLYYSHPVLKFLDIFFNDTVKEHPPVPTPL